MAVATYTKSGAKASSAAKLNKDIFELDVKSFQLIQQAYETYRANGRSAIASTLGRGEVRGGGKKPWRQKGTGRARHGSIRSPIWRGGGITFGPNSNRNFSKALNTKAKRTAIRQALSLANKAETLKVIEDFTVKDGKTKQVTELLGKLEANRNVLIVVENKSKDVVRATNNIPYVKLTQATYLNVYDILNSHSIIITKSAITAVEEWLGGTK